MLYSYTHTEIFELFIPIWVDKNFVVILYMYIHSLKKLLSWAIKYHCSAKTFVIYFFEKHLAIGIKNYILGMFTYLRFIENIYVEVDRK